MIRSITTLLQRLFSRHFVALGGCDGEIYPFGHISIALLPTWSLTTTALQRLSDTTNKYKQLSNQTHRIYEIDTLRCNLIFTGFFGISRMSIARFSYFGFGKKWVFRKRRRLSGRVKGLPRLSSIELSNQLRNLLPNITYKKNFLLSHNFMKNMKPTITIDTQKKQDIRRNVIADISSISKRRKRLHYGIWTFAVVATLAVFCFVFLMQTTDQSDPVVAWPSIAYTSFLWEKNTNKTHHKTFLRDKTSHKVLAYQRQTKKSPVYLKYKSKLAR